MKKNKLLFLASLLMLLSVSLTACYDDKADIAFYSGDQLIDQVGTCTNFVSSVTIYTNSSSQTENLGIAYGKGGYQALSSDAEVVKVAIEGDRLLLTAGGKSGKATVTLTDEKGNQALLPVTCGTGAKEIRCTKQTGVLPIKDGQVQSDIKESVAQAMQNYAPMTAGGKYVLIFKDMSDIEKGGRLLVYKDAQASAVEGTFEYSLVEEGNRLTPRFTFTYNGEIHVLEVPKSGEVSTDSRSIAIIPFTFQENITSQFKEQNPEFTLPDGVEVCYLITAIIKNEIIDIQ